MTPLVLLDSTRQGILQVTMSSPATGNTLDGTMAGALCDALHQAETSADTHTFVLTSSRGPFCTGMPLGDPTAEDWYLDPSPVRQVLDRLAASPLVTIAVVDGPAIGGGVGLAAVCDQVIVGPSASFRLTEVLLALIPAIVLPVLARRVGPQRAYTLALTTHQLGPEQALEAGLADWATTEPASELRRLLLRLRSADGAALRELKRYHARIHPCAAAVDGLAEAALNARLSDPEVRLRLARLHRQGVLL